MTSEGNPAERWATEVMAGRFADEILPELRNIPGFDRYGDTPTLHHFTKRSAVFRCEAGDRAFAVRLAGPDMPKRHTPEAAFQSLTQLRASDPSQQRVPVPRPVASLPHLGVLVTEWIDAPTVWSMARPHRRSDGLAAAFAALDWLEAFHCTEPARVQALDLRNRVEMARRALEKNRHLLNTDDRRRCDGGLARLGDLVKRIDGCPVPFRRLHDDASPSNFLFTGGRAIGFDFHARAFGDPLVDYSRFLVDVDVRLNTHAAAAPPLGIDEALQSRVLAMPYVAESSHPAMRLRFYLLTLALSMFAWRMHPPGRAVDQRPRFRSLIEALTDGEAAARSPS